MARKYGRRKSISLNPLDYQITILGESGIGKTTLAIEVCEKLVGVDGYIHLDIGREGGTEAFEGAMSEPIYSWAKLKEVKNDIVENKNTEDWADLKVAIFDTFDELILLAEAEALRLWNKKEPTKKASTINEAWGGFQRGQQQATELILSIFDDFKSVGVTPLIIGHVKRTDIVDPFSQETYSKITADTTQKYFNSIKNKQHFVALAYIDRQIVKEKTGRQNIVTKEDVTVNKAVSESRVISFRDDTYSVDSKSRFADIVDKIPFDSDAFIKAITDAIIKEKTKRGKSLDEAKKEQEVREQEKEQRSVENSKAYSENYIDTDRNEQIVSIIKEKFQNLEDKTEFKELMKNNGVSNFKNVDEIPTKTLETLAAYFD